MGTGSDGEFSRSWPFLPGLSRERKDAALPRGEGIPVMLPMRPMIISLSYDLSDDDSVVNEKSTLGANVLSIGMINSEMG